MRIFIGSENKLFSLSRLVPHRGAVPHGSQKIVGVVGVIGPTRLNYARIVPMVDYTRGSSPACSTEAGRPRGSARKVLDCNPPRLSGRRHCERSEAF